MAAIVWIAALALPAQNIRELYDKLNPAVAVIHVEDGVRRNHQLVGYQSALGSGVLISEAGDMLTAAHVVQTAERIVVEFHNGEKIPADVVRLVKNADVALLKLRWMPNNYTLATLGDSDATGIGDQVIIIGAPYGLVHSLSVGYISGRRQNTNQTSGFVSTEFLQTDAAINQGNSGGPMFNTKGEIIGIVSYILTESGGFDGIGFVATSNLTKKLLLDSKIPWTGIDGYFLDETTAGLLNLPQKGGILVQNVVNLSPADLAGLRGGETAVILNEVDMKLGGDIILSIAGINLTSQEELEKFVRAAAQKKVPKRIPVKILREGKVKTIEFELE